MQRDMAKHSALEELQREGVVVLSAKSTALRQVICMRGGERVLGKTRESSADYAHLEGSMPLSRGATPPQRQGVIGGTTQSSYIF